MGHKLYMPKALFVKTYTLTETIVYAVSAHVGKKA